VVAMRGIGAGLRQGLFFEKKAFGFGGLKKGNYLVDGKGKRKKKERRRIERRKYHHRRQAHHYPHSGDNSYTTRRGKNRSLSEKQEKGSSPRTLEREKKQKINQKKSILKERHLLTKGRGGRTWNGKKKERRKEKLHSAGKENSHGSTATSFISIPHRNGRKFYPYGERKKNRTKG